MDVNELLKSIDIVDLVSHYVDLEEKNGEYWGLSPFKDEKTPSFSVRRETGRFYCFASGIGGTAITFLKYFYKCSTTEAIEMLKEYAGVGGEIDLKQNNKLVATIACKKYEKPRAQKKPEKSTILPTNFMDRYSRPKDKLDVWKGEGISQEALDKFQVCYDAFSNRLVYPVRNTTGDIVNIGGRALDADWKEKGQSKYCYFYPWGTLNTIYGLSDNIDVIKAKREIIIFEGCKSVLIAHSWGVENCGAILTSHLNTNQLKILAKLGCRVVFALDKDVTITADRNINKLKNYVNVEFLYDKDNLLGEKDSPVDKGFDVFTHIYDQRFKFK